MITVSAENTRTGRVSKIKEYNKSRIILNKVEMRNILKYGNLCVLHFFKHKSTWQTTKQYVLHDKF